MKSITAFWGLFLFVSSLVSAQRSFGTVVAGIESGFDVAQFSDGMKARFSPSLQAEISIGRFTVGAGFGKKFYQPYDYYTYNGNIVERMVNNAIVRYYLADNRVFTPQHWIIPVKLNIRIHRCNCVYLHAGIIFDKVDLSKPDVIKFSGAEFQQPVGVGITRFDLIKERTRSYELGVGFNVFRRDFFRLTARPAYVLTENPEVYADTDIPKWLPTLRFSFAAQFAIWRP